MGDIWDRTKSDSDYSSLPSDYVKRGDNTWIKKVESHVNREEFEGLKKEVQRLNKHLLGLAKALAGRDD